MPIDTRLFMPDPAPKNPLDTGRDHVAQVETPAERDDRLHFGNGPEMTACGKPRAGLEVTDRAAIFDGTKDEKLSGHRGVCPICDEETRVTRGAHPGVYR